VSAETAVFRPSSGRILAVLDRLLAALPLLLPYLVLTIVYGWQASRHGTPWIFGDELEFAQLSRSVAETGELARRGQPLTGQFSLYPYLTAPAWFFEDTKTGYEAAKLIGVLGMTLALFPAYALARMVVSRPAALLAALGATMIPAYSYTSILVEEPLAYPWATLCLYLAARWYVAPTRWTFAAAVAAAAVAPLFRDELVVAPLILLGVGIVLAWQHPRVRTAWQSWHPAVFVALAGVLVVAGYFAEQEVTARSVEWQTVTRVFPERLLEYGVWAAGAFTIGIAVLPVVAALVFLVPGRREQSDRGVDALRVVLGLSILGFGGYTALKAAYVSTIFADRVSERNLIYLSPLVFAAAAAALERRLISLWALPVAALATLYLLIATPYQMEFHFYYDAPGLGILSRANRDYAWTPEHAETVLLWMLAAATAVVLAVALLRSRPRVSLAIGAAAGALVLGWTMTAEFAAATASNSFSRTFLRNLPAPVDWVDNTTGGEPTLYLGQKIADANGVWLHEFWNRSIKRVYSLDGTAPGPGPTVTPSLLNRHGELAGDPGYGFVLAENSIDLVGKILDEKGGWRLYRIDQPLRLRSSQSGIYSDGWVGSQHPADIVSAGYNRFETPGNEASTMLVTVSKKGFCGKNVPGKVLIQLGPLALGQQGNGVLQRATETRRWVVNSCEERTFTLAAPPPPFHVEVTIDGTFVPHELDPSLSERRRLGAMVAFSWIPGAPNEDED
jgi:hypothetical protein